MLRSVQPIRAADQGVYVDEINPIYMRYRPGLSMLAAVFNTTNPINRVAFLGKQGAWHDYDVQGSNVAWRVLLSTLLLWLQSSEVRLQYHNK